jgi:hypothetical protein
MYLNPLELYMLESNRLPSFNYREYYYLNIWVALEFLHSQGLVSNASESVHKQLKEKIAAWSTYLRYEQLKPK